MSRAHRPITHQAASKAGKDVHDTAFVDFLRVEQVGGVVLLAAAALALVAANTGLHGAYESLRELTFGPASLGARLDVEHWAADGLLALFFFVAGLEVKRELVVGELSDRRAAALPALAAVGGMVVPALLYLAVAGGDPVTARGWAVPMATDIAFALGVLSLVGSHAPVGLRVFLLSLAVVDDLGAIAVIAVKFTSDLAVMPLGGAAALLCVYALAQRRRVTSPWLYVPLALAVWLCVHASGVHATVAGVALGLLTRVRADEGEEHSPADRLEHRLQPWSAGVVVPVFAFTAAGVAISGDVLGEAVQDRAAVGVAVGLLVGKTVGILGAAFLAVRLRLARLPEGLGWSDVAGVAVLAGTGFTVSLLLAGLAFEDPARADRVTLAVLVASIVASVLGAAAIRARRSAHLQEEQAC
ncbi:MAG TPA: Na+/H+ antiporter NhaA [Mycobacteriales bacterium]|jgi:NhaA family Na+:H+ antiporter|nr:Na+/H+ antiporter NhaA [Mycobacteriales bacterium]